MQKRWTARLSIFFYTLLRLRLYITAAHTARDTAKAAQTAAELSPVPTLLRYESVRLLTILFMSVPSVRSRSSISNITSPDLMSLYFPVSVTVMTYTPSASRSASTVPFLPSVGVMPAKFAEAGSNRISKESFSASLYSSLNRIGMCHVPSRLYAPSSVRSPPPCSSRAPSVAPVVSSGRAIFL